MDLYEKDRGNVSLPQSLQPPDFDGTELKKTIINTQRCFYDLKIAEINRRIQKLEDQNKELENNIKDTNYYIINLEEESTEEISSLNTQVVAQEARIDNYKKQLMTLEKIRADNKIAHIEKLISINDKYKDTKLMLTSQIKILSAKTNVLEDYKLIQDMLREKLKMQNEALIHNKEEVEDNLVQIERKFKIDIKNLKEDLYNRLLDMAGIFQVEVAQFMPYSMSRLLSENIAITNDMSGFTKSADFKRQDCVRRKEIMKEYKGKIKDAHLDVKRSIVISKLEKSAIAMLHKSYNKAALKIPKLEKLNDFTEDQYITQKDIANFEAQEFIKRKQYLDISLFREKGKLAIAKIQKQLISKQLRKQIQMLYDIKHILMKLKSKNNCE